MIALQALSCICSIVACLTDNAAIDDAAECIDCVADVARVSVCACMQTQARYEMNENAAFKRTSAGPMRTVRRALAACRTRVVIACAGPARMVWRTSGANCGARLVPSVILKVCTCLMRVGAHVLPVMLVDLVLGLGTGGVRVCGSISVSALIDCLACYLRALFRGRA